MPPPQRTGVGEGMCVRSDSRSAQSALTKCSVGSTLERCSALLIGLCVCACVLQVAGVASGVFDAGPGWLPGGGRAVEDSLSSAGAAAPGWVLPAQQCDMTLPRRVGLHCMALSPVFRVLSVCRGGSGDGTGSASTAQGTESRMETGNVSPHTGSCQVDTRSGKATGNY